MATDIFLNGKKHPSDGELRKKLGRAYRLFEETIMSLQIQHDGISFEWKYSTAVGWYLIGLRKKRRLFYFLPKHRDFAFRMVFGEKAAAAMEEAGLPAKYLEMIRSAKRYPEGRLVELGKADFETAAVVKILGIKILN